MTLKKKTSNLLKTYRLTATAEAHLRHVVRNTHHRYGINQAKKYNDALLQGFQSIAEKHLTFHSPHRNELAKDTVFSIHLVEHHYVVFQEQDQRTIVIVGIFHESMDIPSRLRELQTIT